MVLILIHVDAGCVHVRARARFRLKSSALRNSSDILSSHFSKLLCSVLPVQCIDKMCVKALASRLGVTNHYNTKIILGLVKLNKQCSSNAVNQIQGNKVHIQGKQSTGEINRPNPNPVHKQTPLFKREKDNINNNKITWNPLGERLRPPM